MHAYPLGADCTSSGYGASHVSVAFLDYCTAPIGEESIWVEICRASKPY